MKVIFALLPSLRLVYGSLDDEAIREFDIFKQEYSKSYSPDDEDYRRGVFIDNYKWIKEQNTRGDHSYVLGVTRFADMTNEEFATSYVATGLKGSVDDLTDYLDKHRQPTNSEVSSRALQDAPPESINWVDRGVLGPVKDQGQCGSCASFATTGALEAHYALAMGQTGNSIVPLSEQQLLDCIPSIGCNGGLPSLTYPYINTSGITSESNYPYQTAKLACRSDLISTNSLVIQPGVVSGYTQINNNYDELLSAVGLIGPVATMIDGTTPPFQHYKSGIINGTTCDSLTLHIVVIVGYGVSEEGMKYWLIKNSWGTGWGEQGYAKVERGTGGRGRCGIESLSWYPHVNAAAAAPTTTAPTSSSTTGPASPA
ncbi:hypothetical protein FOL47_000660 [Perkinsus chesapeaki]|uniref:Uncharacterized protein n=1 Tax=Perkinsus chesapeaki TaxID=330153 RepID=A0A7J6ML78_PERCH|nr:hypothetical protein FOL47_000660 [Perkinsus chesapeaki]